MSRPYVLGIMLMFLLFLKHESKNIKGKLFIKIPLDSVFYGVNLEYALVAHKGCCWKMV